MGYNYSSCANFNGNLTKSPLSLANRWVITFYVAVITSVEPLQWRHNGRDSVPNHQHHDCFLNRLFRRRSKKTSMLRVTGLCAGNSPGTGEFPAQRASNAEIFSIWRRHHDGKGYVNISIGLFVGLFVCQQHDEKTGRTDFHGMFKIGRLWHEGRAVSIGDVLFSALDPGSTVHFLDPCFSNITEQLVIRISWNFQNMSGTTQEIIN